MPYKFRRDLDPRNNELLERALIAVKQKPSQVDLDSDEQLESELRRELFEIARSYSASDAETLRHEVLLAKHFGVDGDI